MSQRPSPRPPGRRPARQRVARAAPRTARSGEPRPARRTRSYFELLEGHLETLQLAGQLSRTVAEDVGLEYEADPRPVPRDLVDGLLHDRQALVPGALDGREHGVGVVGQPRVAHDTDGRSDRLVHVPLI